MERIELRLQTGNEPPLAMENHESLQKTNNGLPKTNITLFGRARILVLRGKLDWLLYDKN